MTIRDRVPFEDYLAIEAVNYSTLKHMGDSPLAYRDVMENGTESKAEFALGSAAHTAILEPRRFALDYVAQPEKRVNEKGDEVKFVRSGKHWAEFQAANAGKAIITQAQYDAAWDIQERVRKHPVAAMRLATPGKFEVAVTFTDPATGILCKCRIDHLANDGIDELKTTRILTKRAFAAAAYRMRYHWQAAFSRDAVKYATGRSLPVRVLAVQNSRPYDCVVYRFSDMFLEIGRSEYTDALQRVAKCRERNEWPGMATDEEELEPPDWLVDDIESTIETEERDDD